MGNQTHDLDTNNLTHRSRTLYHYTKHLRQKTKFIRALLKSNLTYMCTCHELMILINKGTN